MIRAVVLAGLCLVAGVSMGAEPTTYSEADFSRVEKIDTHVHQGVFRIKDKNTVESVFVAFANGKPRPEGRAILKRKVSE